MSTSELDVAREVLAKYYKATEPYAGVHTVTFQPLANKSSQDRVVAQQWEIAGQKWLFLAVFDGGSLERKRCGVQLILLMFRSRW